MARIRPRAGVENFSYFAPAAAAFLARLEPDRFGGVPSAISTTIMLVTNFLMPWASKSMVVRSASDWVTTPHPYTECLIYRPSVRAFTTVSFAGRSLRLLPGDPSTPSGSASTGRKNLGGGGPAGYHAIA